MRIAIDVTPSVRTIGGIGRFARELACVLQTSHSSDEEIFLFINDRMGRRLPPPLHAPPVKALTLPAKLWRLAVMTAHLCRYPQDRLAGNPDIFIACDHLLPCFDRTQSLFVVHDLTFRILPSAHLPLSRFFLRMMMSLFLKRADAVIAVSESTRRDLMRYYNVPGDSIHVVYEGVSPHFRPAVDQDWIESVRRRYGLPDRFALFLGTIEPRKNIPVLLDVLTEIRKETPDLSLVISGQKGWRAEKIVQRIKKSASSDNVVVTGVVAEKDLPALYTMASVFLFPSHYEGFGLPVLEAMACGTPVICTNTSSLPEIVGKAAMLLPPDDTGEWINGIRHVMNTPESARDMRCRGVETASRFRWEETADRVLKIARDVFGKKA